MFSRQPTPRRGVSELYASLLMMGVTISLGSVVAGMAITQYGLSSGAASLSTSLQEEASGVQVSLITAAVSGQGSCPSYKGSQEGSALVLTVFDYGPTQFTPSEVFVNGTAYFGSYAPVLPGGIETYSFPLVPSGTCAHPSGQVVLMADSQGDEVEFGT